MAFWDKLFRNKEMKTEAVQENTMVIIPNIESKDTIKECVEHDSKTVVQSDVSSKEELVCEFEYIILDDAIRQTVIDYLQPFEQSRDIINLQLGYGVVEKSTGTIFIRRAFDNSTNPDTGFPYEVTSFLAIYYNEIIPISIAVYKKMEGDEVTYQVPDDNEIFIQGIDFWENHENRKVFEKQYNSNHEKSLLHFSSQFINSLRNMLPEEKPIVPKHFEINSVEDAKELFFLCDRDPYGKMLKEYDKETVEKFKEYAPYKVINMWYVEYEEIRCREILQKLLDGNTEELYRKLSTIYVKCGYWENDFANLADMYYKVCLMLFDSDIYIPIFCITQYLEKYAKRFDMMKLLPLMNATKQYIDDKYSKWYPYPEALDEMKDFKCCCAEIRGKIKERSPINNYQHFAFVLTSKERNEQIVNYYRKKYRDKAAIKECLAEYNCLYGVQNEDVFVTALNESAENLDEWKRFKMEFVAVNLKDGEVMEFRCERNLEDGSLEIVGSSFESMSSVMIGGVDFLRNQIEREKFFQEYQQENEGVVIHVQKKETRKKLFSKLGTMYQDLKNRIDKNPLKATLKSFVELCELEAPNWGYRNVIVGDSVSKEKIQEWESKNGISLPESYIHFLTFADGISLSGCNQELYSLEGIVLSDEHIEEDYMIIGNMIGDGTMICLSKSNGEVYIEDHGRYTKKGDFHDFLKCWVDFARG